MAIPTACYLNNGQACIAASRLIVPEDRLDEVKRLAKAAVEKIKMGDPTDKGVTLGPLASTKQYKRVQEYIKSGIEEGAELVTGGEGHPQGLEGGNFIKPTVFANVTREMRIAKEEIFGPVLSILTYKTRKPRKAIEIANDTEFGLIAYVSSADPEKGRPCGAQARRRPRPDQHIESRSVCSLRWVQTIRDRSGGRDLRAAGVPGTQSDHRLARGMS